MKYLKFDKCFLDVKIWAIEITWFNLQCTTLYTIIWLVSACIERRQSINFIIRRNNEMEKIKTKSIPCDYVLIFLIMKYFNIFSV